MFELGEMLDARGDALVHKPLLEGASPQLAHRDLHGPELPVLLLQLNKKLNRVRIHVFLGQLNVWKLGNTFIGVHLLGAAFALSLPAHIRAVLYLGRELPLTLGLNAGVDGDIYFS